MNRNNIKLYRVYNANGRHIGDMESATKAGELLQIDAYDWDFSGKTVQVTLSNVGGQFCWTDTRFATESLLPLLKITK